MFMNKNGTRLKALTSVSSSERSGSQSISVARLHASAFLGKKKKKKV